MANNISYTYSLVDNFSRAATRITATLKRQQEEIRRTTQRMKDLSKGISNIGRTLSRRLTAPIIAFGTAGVIAYSSQEKALNALTASYAVHGERIGKTFDELNAQADRIQATTKTSSEDFINLLLVPLMQFSNITGDALFDTADMILDIVAKTGRPIRTVVTTVGAAVNNLSGGLRTLEDRGARYTDQQKEMIISLHKNKEISEAMIEVLEGLRKGYTSLELREAEHGLGIVVQMKNELADLSAVFGKLIVFFIEPYAASIRDWAIRSIEFLKANQGIAKALSMVLAILFILGPVVFIVGKSLLIFSVAFAAIKWAALAAGMGMSVFLLKAVAIIAALVLIMLIGKQLWQAMKWTWGKFIDLVDYAVDKFWSFIDTIKTGIDYITAFGDKLRSFFSIRDKFSNMMGRMGSFFGGETAYSMTENSNLNVSHGTSDLFLNQRMGADVTVNIKDSGNNVQSVEGQVYGNGDLALGTNMAMGY